MRILICRHGDPDYEHDALTERGVIEAELLSQRLVKRNPTKIYCSPLGRARLTAKPTVEKTGIEPVIFDWLQEYPVSAKRYEGDEWTCPWGIRHEDWIGDRHALDAFDWATSERFIDCGFEKQQKYINDGFDSLLDGFGVHRNGAYYDVDADYSHETILLFCHFGLGLSLVSHALPVSPALLWNGFYIAPTSVTELRLEKFAPDKGILRCVCLGDTSHIYAAGIKPSECGLRFDWE